MLENTRSATAFEFLFLLRGARMQLFSLSVIVLVIFLGHNPASQVLDTLQEDR